MLAYGFSCSNHRTALDFTVRSYVYSLDRSARDMYDIIAYCDVYFFNLLQSINSKQYSLYHRYGIEILNECVTIERKIEWKIVYLILMIKFWINFDRKKVRVHSVECGTELRKILAMLANIFADGRKKISASWSINSKKWAPTGFSALDSFFFAVVLCLCIANETGSLRMNFMLYWSILICVHNTVIDEWVE